ncbi:MAG: putative dehydrogenase [Symbiobacteriaceae bacterium]|nr:putative dehydrogenase [Symbiobacteriaceae bacterium]
MSDPNKVTIIACSGDLDKAYPILILASTAAASGKEVTIFFSFWGLFIIKKNDGKIIGKDWMTKMLSWMHRGGSERLKLSQYRMGGMGTWMMNQVFRKNKVAKLSELLEMCQDLGVRMIPCQMTMDAFGMTMDDLVAGVEQPVGAATALEYASQAGINWFI